MSLLEDSRVEIGSPEERRTCLFEEVVRRIRVLIFGSRDWRPDWSVEIGVSAGRGRERVGGRLSP